jgi:hypothetical protein
MKKVLAEKTVCFFAVFATSATALSIFAASSDDAVHPIVDAQYGYLLGGSRNGKWLNDKQTAATLKGGEIYRVWGERLLLGATTGSKARTNEAPCDETWWVKPQRNFGSGVIALGASWNAQPRKIRTESTSNRFYRTEVARNLQRAGIKKPRVVLSQLWRTDLDGDGRDEVLISATNYGGQKAGPMHISSNAKAGEYSLVMLRCIVKGRSQTTTLAQEIYTQNKTFAAPSEFRLAGILDVNGDGRMEIIIRSRYYEGDSLSIYEVESKAPREVLSSGCGA